MSTDSDATGKAATMSAKTTCVLVIAATLATILLGMDWPFTVRAILCPVAVSLWLWAVRSNR